MNSADTANLARTLDHALGQVPFYERWRIHDPGADQPVETRYAALPHLTKRDIRAHMPRGFVPSDRDFKAGVEAGEVELVLTSGTTEDRSSIVWYQPWWDASEHAAATLHAGLDKVINGRQREAVLSTPLCAGTVCHIGDLPVEERTMGRLLFLNQQADPALWSSRDMERMIRELDAFKPELLEADPAYLAILCRYAAENGLSLAKPDFISLTYEFPSCLHYRQIRRVFPDTRVLSSYGSTETGHILTECEHGRFHQNTEYCHLDVQPLKSSRGNPLIGRLLVTTLGNPWVSLLRFDIGDLVRLETRPCPCGRVAGHTVSRVLGRVRDLTFTHAGRAVTVDELDRIVGQTDSLVTYQMEQTTRQDYVFHYVAASGRTVPAAAILSGLKSLYGSGARITMRAESAIPTEPSGKFRLARTAFSWNPEDVFKTRDAHP
jgi:phenylacetate-CoA ligase